MIPAARPSASRHSAFRPKAGVPSWDVLVVKAAAGYEFMRSFLLAECA